MKHRVMIVEDQAMVREFMERRIAGYSAYQLQYSIENAALADVYCARGDVDLVLMDIYTAMGESGLDAAARIKKAHPQIKVILCTSVPEHSFIERAKEAGVDSFWYKDTDEIRMIDVMDKTMRGEAVWPGLTPTVSIGKADKSEFGPEEKQLLRHLAQGKTDEQIAEEMHLSVWTVRKYIKALLKKTGLPSRTGLAAEVTSSGFILTDV